MADSYQLKAILSAVDRMSPTLKAIAQQSRNTRKYLLDVGSSAGNLADKLGLPLAALSSLAAGASIAGLKRMVTGFVESGAHLDDTAKRMGMSATELQALAYVAEQSDVSVEGLQGSVGKLNKNIAAAAAGKNKELSEMFRRLHISLRGANGQLRSGVELLPELADAFKANTNAAMRARMGNVAFGKSYQELLPLLVDGSEGIRQSMERWKDVGFPLTEEDVALAAKMDDQFVDLRHAFGGLSIVVGKTLAPVLGPLIEGLIKWASANRELIANDVKKFVEGIARAINDMGGWDGIYKRIKAVGSALSGFIDWLGGSKNALIALVVAINLQAIVACASLLGSIGRLGLSLGGLALQALAPIAPLQGLSASLVTVNAQGAAAIGMIGRLAGAFGVVGAAYAGWEIGKILNEHVINPLAEKATGTEGETLGTALYGLLNDTSSITASTPLRAPPQKMQGSIDVNFLNAPPGMRVGDSKASSGFVLDPTVGYRSAATGG